MADDPWQLDRTSEGLDLRNEGPNRGVALVCLRRKIGNRPVVYFGLNKAAHVEAENVRRKNANKGGVTKIINIDYTAEVVEQRTKDGQVQQLVSTWCLPEDQGEAVVRLLEGFGDHRRGRLLLSLLAGVYAEAETGRRKMERIVLSGESFGASLFSNCEDDDQSDVDLEFSTFLDLANIFPVATGQVKHLLVSACNAGFPGNMQVYREIFPRVQTIMAYASKSPEGRGKMARSDFEYWSSHTSREGCRSLAPRRQRPDPAHPENGAWIKVATWSIRGDYRVNQDPLPVLLAKIERLEPKFKARLTGEVEPEQNPAAGVVHDYFRFLTELIHRGDYTDRRGTATYALQQRQAMRLRYWSKIVRGRFGEEYQDKLREGLGLKMPNFATLTRKKLKEILEQLKAAKEDGNALASGKQAEISEALGLLQGLFDLDEGIIPQEWLERRRPRPGH